MRLLRRPSPLPEQGARQAVHRDLSTGATLTFAAGETTKSYAAPAQGDDVFKDEGKITVSITKAEVSPVTAQLTVDNPTVAEGGKITYTVTLVSADPSLPVTNHKGLTFTLTDGTIVTVKAVTITQGLTKVEGAGADQFEQLNLGKDTVSTVVTDEPGTPVTQVAITKATWSRSPSLRISCPRSISHSPYLSTGATLTFAAGETTKSYAAPAQGDDVFKDEGKITVSITKAEVVGEQLENLQIGQPASVAVTDTQSPVTAQLTVDNTLADPSLPVTNHKGLTFTLTDGTTVTVKAGEATGSVTVTAPDNVYVNDPVTITQGLTKVEGAGADQFEQLNLAKILADPSLPVTNHKGLTFTLTDGTTVTVKAGEATGSVTVTRQTTSTSTTGHHHPSLTKVEGAGADQFEQLNLGKDTVSTVVTDEPGTPGNPGNNEGDLVKVTIVADQVSVNEATEPTFTVTLNKALDKPFTVTLSTGATLTFAAGETTKSYAAPAQGDDVFKDEGKITVSITKAEVVGEQLENLQIGQPASVAVTDTQSPVTAQLTVDNTTVAEGGKITYTVTLVSADPSLPVTNHKGLTFTLTDGTIVTVKAGESVGTTTVTAPDNVYVNDPVTITQGLTKVEGAGADQFEQLNLGKNTVSTVVTDEPGTPGNPGGNNEGDLVKVSIVADQVSVNEATEPTFTVTLNKALDKPFTVTLSTGATLTFAAGETTKSYAAPAQGDDVFKDEGKITVSITKAEVVAVTDTQSPVTAQLTVDNTTVAEGGKITYTVTLVSADPSLPVTNHKGLTFTLTDGTIVTVKAGESVGTTTVTAPDNVYVNDPVTITQVVTDEPGTPGNPGGNNEGDLVKVSIVADQVSVNEATEPTFTVTLNKALDKPFTVILSTGATLTFAAGETTKSYAAPAQGDDVFKDEGKITVSITKAEVVEPVTAQLTVDNTTVAEGGKITYTVTLVSADPSLPVTNHKGLTFTLTDGTIVTVKAGESVGTTTVTAPDNVYVNDPVTITQGLTKVEGAGADQFEQLNLGKNTVSTVVTDEPGTPVSVNEATEPTFTVTLNKALDKPFTVTLSTGATLTFAAGETTKSYAAPAQGDDVFKDEGKITVSITKAEVVGEQLENLQIGQPASVAVTDTQSPVTAQLTVDNTTVPKVEGAGADQFEQLNLGKDTVSTVVTDEPGTPGNPGGNNEGDLVKVTIVADQVSVNEATEPTFTVTLNKALDKPFTVTLSTGATLTFAAGETTKSYAAPAQGDDVFKDEGKITVSITKAEVVGEQLENLQIGQPASVAVTDTQSPVTAQLTVDNTTVAEGGKITYTVTLVSADPSLPVTNHKGLTFTLTDGTIVTVKAGESVGTTTVTAPDNVYVNDPVTITQGLTKVEGAGADQFEQLNLGKDTVSTVVTDEPGTPVSVNEATEPTFTVTLNKALDKPFTVTLSTGATLTFAAGETTKSYAAPAQGDDVFKDEGKITVSITKAEVVGEQLENLQIGQPAGKITYTVTLVSADPSLPVTNHKGLTFTLTDGTIVTVKAGESVGTTTVTAPDNVYVNDPVTITQVVTDEPGTPGNPGGNNEGDLVKVSIVADQVSVNEATEPTFTVTLNKALDKPFTVTLSTGATLTFAAGETTKSYAAPAQGDDVSRMKARSPSASPRPKWSSPVTAQLTVDNTTVAEGGKITYTVTLVSADPSLPVTNHKGLTFTLTDGTIVTSKPVNRSAPPRHCARQRLRKRSGHHHPRSDQVEGAGADQFEQLNLGKNTVSTVVTDEPGTPGNPGGNNEGDLVKVSIVADQVSVNEATEPTFTVTLNKALDKPFTVTLSTGATLTFAAGETTKSYAAPAQGDDVFKDEGKITVSITKAEVVAVTDTQSPVTAELSVDNTTVSEGGKITYTVTLVSADPSLPVTNHKGLTFTLTDGTTVTVKAGEPPVRLPFTAPDNVYVNDPVTITQGLTKVEGAGADQFEQLNLGKDTVSTVVTDEPGTPGNPGGNNEGDLVKVSIPEQAAGQGPDRHLSNNDTVLFKAGETSKVYTAPAQVPNATFEKLEFSNPASVSVTDTESKVTAVLSVDKSTVAEGGAITYTVTLVGDNSNLPVTGHGGVTVTLSGGTQVTINAGGQPTITKSITDITVSGDKVFEKLVPSTTSVSTSVTDEPSGQGDLVKVSIVANQSSVNEATAPTFTVSLNKPLDKDLTVTLSNNDTVLFKAGETSKVYTAPAQGDDVFKDPGTVTQPGLGQRDRYRKQVTAVLSVDKSTVAEGGAITYTVTLVGDNSNLPVTGHGGVTVTLSGGTQVTINAGSATGSVTINAPDDVYVGGQPTITKSITDITVSGDKVFEKLVRALPAIVANQSSVNEATAPTFTVSLNKPLDKDLTVTLSNNDTVLFKAGETSKVYTAPAQGDDVFKDPGTVTQPGLGQRDRYRSKVTAVLSVDKSTVAEGGAITYTVTLVGDNSNLPVTGHGGVTVTLSGGTQVTINAGSATGSVTINAPDDVYVGGQPTITKSITDITVSGDKVFEKLVPSTTSVSTSVTDEPSGQGDVAKVSINGTTSLNEGETGTYTLNLTTRPRTKSPLRSATAAPPRTARTSSV
uniref:LapA adhesin domain-containing protein n=2 Tax=cellular organisms TaxID=131567 RepID=A0A915DUE4_9BILA